MAAIVIVAVIAYQGYKFTKKRMLKRKQKKAAAKRARNAASKQDGSEELSTPPEYASHTKDTRLAELPVLPSYDANLERSVTRSGEKLLEV